MTIQRHLITWTLSLAGVAGLIACDGQPDPQCTVGRGEHAVRYTLKAKTGTGTCDQKKAEIVGAQAFRLPGSRPGTSEPPTVYFNAASLVTSNPSGPPSNVSASGAFLAVYPSEDHVCTVPSMSRAALTVGGVERGYQWSNVRVQSQAAIPGTQWVADVTYSEGDCSATYEAVGVFPAIRCVNAQGARDPEVCKVVRQGASLDPAFPIDCEETTNLCVLRGLPPGYGSP